MNQVIAEAKERQDAARRVLSHRAFPDGPADPGQAPIEQARTERRLQVAATEAATLHRAREERAARKAETEASVPRWTPLGRTA